MSPSANDPSDTPATGPERKGQYATVNGLKMYYEIHGEGEPLLLLHGGYHVIEALEPLLSTLARSRKVIAVELEGHGRTTDLDRPLRQEQMAEDVAGLLDQLGIAQTDILGYSLGGQAALGIAIQRPDLVRKLVLVSAPYNQEGFYPSTRANWPEMSAETMIGTPMEQAYKQVAPEPTHWPVFVEKMKHALMDFPGWSTDDVREITAPTLIVIGDADFVRPEFALEMFRLLGGARPDGGMAGIPASQLAVLPATTHFSILYRVDLLLPVITPFLDAPQPGSNTAGADDAGR